MNEFEGNTVKKVKSPFLRFRWSHQIKIHRFLVKKLNCFSSIIPFNIKYRIGLFFCRKKIPYSLVKGKNVIQVGAPRDTLLSGRSRGMYFSLLVGEEGKTFIIEPDKNSIIEYKHIMEKKKIGNIVLCDHGAWSKKGNINLYINKSHPATNFSEGTVSYDNERLKEFIKTEIQVDTLDNIIEGYNIQSLELVSITTNWAELEILFGLTKTISTGIPYISIAFGNPGIDYVKFMQKIGYSFFSYDDRGITFNQYMKFDNKELENILSSFMQEYKNLTK